MVENYRKCRESRLTLIVQKYGGSSLENAEKIRNAANRIIKTCDNGNQVVVVVSAMGDTTDKLTELAYQMSELSLIHI